MIKILIPTWGISPKDIDCSSSPCIQHLTACRCLWYINALYRHCIGAAQLPNPRQIICVDAWVPRWIQDGNLLSLRRWSWLAQNPHIDANLISSQHIHMYLGLFSSILDYFGTYLLNMSELCIRRTICIHPQDWSCIYLYNWYPKCMYSHILRYRRYAAPCF